MAKRNDNTIIFLLAAATGLYLYSQSKKENIIPDPGNDNITQDHPYYPIVFGQYAPDAKLLQKALGVKEDGIIGSNTLTVWQRYRIEATRRFKISSPSELKYEIDIISKQRNH